MENSRIDGVQAKSGFFFAYNDHLRKQISDVDFEKFSKLTSNEARVDFVCQLTVDKPIVPEKPVAVAKDQQLAVNLKKVGNAHFQNGKWMEALKFYSESLLQMPKENAEEISILYANRSAALYHLQDFKAALNDMARSVAHNYPEHLLHKVRERQARCYLALKQSADALQSFKATIQALDHSKMPFDKRAKIEKDAQVMIKILQREEELLAQQKKPKPEVKSEVEEKNTQTFVSPAMAYDSTKEEGRFAVAKKQINVAEPIIVEKPYCSVLLEPFCKSNCENCFKRIYIPVPCGSCPSVMYCSDKCHDSAQATFHKYECGQLPVIWASGISVTCHMALRMISQQTVDYFLALKDDLDIKIEQKDWDIYANSDYRKVYGLGTHAESRNSEDLFQRSVMAKFLLELLVTANYFDGHLDAKRFIGGLILHNLQVVQTNAHEIAELQQANPKDSGVSEFIGGGLYPTLALLNHSCEPGVVRYFRGNTAHVHAVKTIRPGEQIAENYGQIYTQTPREQRQRALKAQFMFECHCVACTNNWPLFKEMDNSVIRFKCTGKEGCANTIIIPVDVKDFIIKCTECGEFTNIMKGLKALQDTDALFKTAIRLHDSGETKKALVKYVEMMKILDENLVPPFRDYNVCQQGIRRCFLELGNRVIVK